MHAMFKADNIKLNLMNTEKWRNIPPSSSRKNGNKQLIWCEHNSSASLTYGTRIEIHSCRRRQINASYLHFFPFQTIT